MKYFAILLSAVYIALVYLFVCKNQTVTASSAAETMIEAPIEISDAPPAFAGLNLRYNDLAVSSPDPIKFRVGETTPVFGAEVENFLEQVTAFLNDNPGQQLHLVSNFTASESAAGGATDAGISRAEVLKAKIAELTGLTGERITLESRQVDRHKIISDTIGESIAFSIKEMPKTPEQMVEEAGERLRGKTQLVYFEYAKAEIINDQKLQNYVADLKYYLTNKAGAKATVTGHTDNVSSSLTNDRLSRKRAQTVKQFLVDQGIPAGQLITKGMGERAPIASNETEEGQAKNRRCEITLN